MNLPSSKTRRTDDTPSLSGEIGLGANGTVPAGIEAQTRNTFDRNKATLESKGLTLASAVSATCHLADISDFAGFNRVYTEYFSDPLPLRTTVQSGLTIDAKVEITVIAEA